MEAMELLTDLPSLLSYTTQDYLPRGSIVTVFSNDSRLCQMDQTSKQQQQQKTPNKNQNAFFLNREVLMEIH